MTDLYFEGTTPPIIVADAFSGCNPDLVLHAPKEWKYRTRILGGAYLVVEGEGGGSSSGGEVQQVNVTVTNVVVQYVLNSVQPQFAVPASADLGFVNILTEVKSNGAVAVPASWAENCPGFVGKFGGDFTAALGKATGKLAADGTPMLVWHDYVAGTDPTDPSSKFTASITLVDGEVKVSYSPELDDERKALRKYTVLGKRSLLDTDWTEVRDSHAAEFNFFKVTVEMR